MGQAISYCVRCSTQLRDADFEKGKAFRIDATVCCAACAPEAVRSGQIRIPAKEAPKKAPPSERTPRPRMSGSQNAIVTPPPSRRGLLIGAAGLGAAAVIVVVLLLSLGGGGKTPAPEPAPAPTPPKAVVKKAPTSSPLDEARAYARSHPDDLEGQIAEINRKLRERHADHPYIPLLLSAPGIGWVLAFTIAAEIGEIERFASPQKLAGYTGLCPRVNQSGDRDRRGPLTKHGPTYLRWALLEATMHALKHPAYAERYQRNKRRLGRQRGAKVAQVDIARRLAHAIWHMLTSNQQFAPRGAAFRLAA